MTKNLLKQVMMKEGKRDDGFDSKAFIEIIEKGYLVGREPKYAKKKSFSPSKIAYGEGKCARYWYLAFEGAVFEDNADPYAVANMSSGTMSHDRVLGTAFANSGLLIDSEFQVVNQDPPIFGYCDGLVNWEEEDFVVELKTANNDVFEYRKKADKPKLGHVEQLLLYMKILKKAKGMIVYENKNTHELLVFPIEVNGHYIKWVDGAFDWMRSVRKAWEDKTIPKKTYRSNSKVCKNCPLSKVCSEAEVGELKIEPLEELSEAV